MPRTFIISLALIALAYAAYLVYAEENPYLDNGAKASWTAIPPVVKDTAILQVHGGEVKDIIKGMKGKKVIYKIDGALPDGEKITIKVDETGKLIGLRYADENEEDFGSLATR